MNKKQAEEILDTYTNKIKLILFEPFMKSDDQAIFCLALLYTCIKMCLSLPIPKEWLAGVFKKTLEEYDDSIDRCEIIKSKMKKALEEAMELIKENEKDPEVS